MAIEEKGASNGNDGTRAVYQGDKLGPWRSVQRALQAARPGDTLLVGSGRYLEELSITTPRIQLRALALSRFQWFGLTFILKRAQRFSLNVLSMAPIESRPEEGSAVSDRLFTCSRGIWILRPAGGTTANDFFGGVGHGGG